MNTQSLLKVMTLLCLTITFCRPVGAAEDTPSLMAMSARTDQRVIARAWHGKTVKAKADEYQQILVSAIRKFPTLKGNLGYQMMGIDGGPDGDEYVEFQVISYWDSLESIKAYAGADTKRTRDLPQDKDFLVKMEPLVRNYELVVNAIRP